jgi:hypothetical protein
MGVPGARWARNRVRDGVHDAVRAFGHEPLDDI